MEISSDDRLLAILSHVLTLVSCGIIAPIIIYLAKKDNPYVREHARRSLNFQLSFVIYFFISGLLCVVLVGFVLIPILGVVDVVFVIIATVKASQDIMYTYPLSLELIK